VTWLWVWVLLATWVLIAVLAAVVVGRALHLAERRERGARRSGTRTVPTPGPRPPRRS